MKKIEELLTSDNYSACRQWIQTARDKKKTWDEICWHNSRLRIFAGCWSDIFSRGRLLFITMCLTAIHTKIILQIYSKYFLHI